MNIQQIRKILGDELYHQAIDCTQMGHLKNFTIIDNKINSEVQGDDIYPCKVDIDLKDNTPASSYCTCSSHAMCIHIAVVLVHFSKLKKSPQSKLISKEKKNKNEKTSTPAKLTIIEEKPEPVLEIDIEKKIITVNLFFAYRNRRVSLSDVDDLINLKPQNIHRSISHAVRRDKKKEFEIKRKLDHLLAKKHINNYNKKSCDYALPLTLQSFIDQFGKDLEILRVDTKLKIRKHPLSYERGKLELNISSSAQWFNIEAQCNDGYKKEKIYFDQSLLKHGIIKSGKKLYALERNEINALKRLINEGMTNEGRASIAKLNIDCINAIYDYVNNKENKEITAIQSIGKKLTHFDSIENYAAPKKFNGKLRDYQAAGYNWLNFLHEYNINGCLADDMGLGKTIQTLALLQCLKENNNLKTSLIVLPVITMANWEREIKIFTPYLTTLRHSGAARKKNIDFLKQYDLILVSYQTLRNDVELFKKIDFDYIILDEAQNIKNSSSQIYRHIMSLASSHRLSLTGTPIENSTLELWSQMNFLNPGLVGTFEKFKSKYTKGIESENNSHLTEELKKLIYPFILRRKKEDVLKDLPPKEEIVIYAEMDMKQRQIYNNYCSLMKKNIASVIDEKGKNNSGIEILSALLKLRQISLFPSFVDEEYNSIESCKFTLLKDMIREILEEDHKILIFSQFVYTLQIIKEYLDQSNIDYSYIDGSTKNREHEINQFQKNQNRKVFLLSLKAGGVGINLTAADYVILFDPWWNPAVERQAVDRSHRIGQKNKVISYKMIVKDSIEEKMLQLQEKKSLLSEGLISEDSSLIKNLSRDDILDLFS